MHLEWDWSKSYATHQSSGHCTMILQSLRWLPHDVSSFSAIKQLYHFFFTSPRRLCSRETSCDGYHSQPFRSRSSYYRQAWIKALVEALPRWLASAVQEFLPLYQSAKELLCCQWLDAVYSLWVSWTTAGAVAFAFCCALTVQLHSLLAPSSQFRQGQGGRFII